MATAKLILDRPIFKRRFDVPTVFSGIQRAFWRRHRRVQVSNSLPLVVGEIGRGASVSVFGATIRAARKSVNTPRSRPSIALMPLDEPKSRRWASRW